MKPSVGRIVHYVMPGRLAHRAAVVTHVWNATAVSLHVFAVESLDFMSPFAIDSVCQGEPTTNLPGSWHWPERDE